MQARWKTREEAVTAIKLHSTVQNRRVKIDRKKSGSTQVVLTCYGPATKTEKNKEDPRFCCTYRVCIRRSKSKMSTAGKPWYIPVRMSPKDFLHSENCLSKGSISTKEAILHTKNTLVRSAVASINNTRKRISIDNGIPDTAIKDHIAYKVRQSVCVFHVSCV